MTDDLRAQLQATLGSAYALERELGGGGMSRVFVADEVALGRKVVVKVVAPELVEGVSAERFTREVKLAARLQQANIVPVLTAGAAAGMPYYTMPYVDGLSLRARLQQGVVPVGEAIGILRDVARALAYAHAQGVVHRDIKPENILLSGGAAVVTDFGIAKALSASRTQETSTAGGTGAGLTRAGMSLGTPAYMAPEQALGDPATDHRADLYGWGMVAWELVAGAHPFAGRTTPHALVAAHIGETPALLWSVRSDVPASLSALVQQCLEKDPAMRPTSAQALLAALDTTTSSPAAAPPPQPRAAAGRQRRALVASGVFIAVLALAAGWMLRNRAQPGTAAATARTVVVIPFENLGAAEDAYFADGITEEIAGRLARIPGLQVVARASVLRYRGSDRTPQEIARELGAEYALSGTIRWARNADATGSGANDSTMVRIVPSLVRVGSDGQLWGEPLQQRLTDVFEVQAEVAERVAAALSLTLGAADLAALRRPDSRDADARDAQLLGRELLRKRGLANLQRAVMEFRKAIARDSNYARAWAGYSEAYGYLPTYFDPSVTAEAAEAESERAARRAIALDSLLPDAHTALATALEHAFRFNEGLAAANRAVALDPGNGAALKAQGVLLLALGRIAEAEAPLRRTVEVDPLVPINHVELATWYVAVGQADSARRAVNRSVELDSTNTFWQFPLQIMAAEQGRMDEAIAACTRLSGRAETCRDLWTGVLNSSQRALGIRVLDALGHESNLPFIISPVEQAYLYAKLDVADSAFARLRRAVHERSPYFYANINNPFLRPLHADPRWDAIIGEVRRR